MISLDISVAWDTQCSCEKNEEKQRFGPVDFLQATDCRHKRFIMGRKNRVVRRAGHSLIFLWFAIRSPLNFFPLDRWRSCVHFFNFPFRSSLKRLSLNQWFAERKRAKSLIACYWFIIYLYKVLCLAFCHRVIVAERGAIIYVLVIKLTTEKRRRVYRCRDRKGRDTLFKPNMRNM
jgi:hypothetical protein